MIELQLNGRNIPWVILQGVPYTFTVLVNGYTPMRTEWSVVAGFVTVASGTGNVQFTPASTIPHYISVNALRADGYQEETVEMVNVASRRGTVPTVTVQWNKVSFEANEKAEATIVYADPEGLPPRSLSWILKFNDSAVETGTKSTVTIKNVQRGLYRLMITCVDAAGATIETDSTVKVEGGFEIRPAIPFVQPQVSLVHIGDAFSHPIHVAAAQSTELPFALTSETQRISLIPGTTWFRLSLKDGTSVDDEIVVRTNSGNWAVVGPPTGLAGESLGYDYALNSGLIAAPADYYLDATFDVWNVHGLTAQASAPVVKFECFTEAEASIYQYGPCRYSFFPGGEGSRQRRFALVFERLLIDDDAWNTNSPASTAPRWIATTVGESFVGRLTASGSPLPIGSLKANSMTEYNVSAVYQHVVPGEPTVEAYEVYGIPEVRPCVITLTRPAPVPIIRKVLCVQGKMGLYIASGAVQAGTTMLVEIRTQAPPGKVAYVVPIIKDVYSSDQDTFFKVGEVNVNISDYGFTLGGIVADLTLNE